MRILFSILLAGSFALVLVPRRAEACGGFFCSSSPVDQSSERIIFALNDDGTTDMIVQIAYQGDSKDFAWLLPLAEVPDADKLDTFPDQAITSLDTGTAPLFTLPANCQFFGGSPGGGFAGGGGNFAASPVSAQDAGGVSVFIQQTVGPYDVAVIGSEDAMATYQWLLDNGYRITSAMNEFVKLYTTEHMKFLALKLTDTADVSQVQPFRLRLPGSSPSIPLRLTSIAALPEMGVVVWIFGKERYEPAGEAKEVEIAKKDLRWLPNRVFGQATAELTNWRALVARAADAAQGKAWVVEQAGPTEMLAGLIGQQPLSPQSPQAAAQKALTDLISTRPYMTRLYTRLSPEEMTYDPLFKRSNKGNVDRTRELPFIASLCDQNSNNDVENPCDFNPCGSLGMCRNTVDDQGVAVAACACAPGLTARAVVPASFTATSISCIDERLSFLNTGDRGPTGDVLPDPCVGVDCGENGTCVNMNMTPTCECKPGFVARAKTRMGPGTGMTCVQPTVAIPSSFYGLRMPERTLPMGREVRIIEVPAADDADASDNSSCALTSGRAGSGNLLSGVAALFAAGLWGRRRRRSAR
jgi:hypothetical protein